MKLFVIAILVFVTVLLVQSQTTPPNPFVEFGIIPDVIQKSPIEVLKVIYRGDIKVLLGNELTPTEVKDQPYVSWDGDTYAFYTLIMTDPDAPSRKMPYIREVRHWYVVNIPGIKVEEGEVLFSYVGSGPPKDTGLHRYVFLVYKQPEKLEFDEPRVSNKSRNQRWSQSTANFVRKYNLSGPVAGNFYQAQYDDYVPILHEQLNTEDEFD